MRSSRLAQGVTGLQLADCVTDINRTLGGLALRMRGCIHHIWLREIIRLGQALIAATCLKAKQNSCPVVTFLYQKNAMRSYSNFSAGEQC